MDKNERKKLLELLEKNSRLSPAELAAMLDMNENDIKNEIKLMEDDGIICGYHTLINWDKADEEKVMAMIGVKISPVRGEGFDRISTRISKFDEVRSVYLMSGSTSDLILTIEGDSLKDISKFVYEKIAPMDTVVSTASYFVLKKYKANHIALTGSHNDDDRIPVQA